MRQSDQVRPVVYDGRKKRNKHTVAFKDGKGEWRVKSHRHKPAAVAFRLSRIEAGSVPEAAAEQSVVKVMEEFLNDLNAKPQTLKCYRVALHLHLRGHFGDLLFAELDTARILHFEAWVGRQNWSKSMRVRMYRIFGGAFAMARRLGFVSSDRKWSPPRTVRTMTAARAAWAKRKNGRPIPDGSSIAKLLETEGLLGIIILLILRCGLRIGEALALQWGDVDFDGKSLSIRATLSDVEMLPVGRRGVSEKEKADLDPYDDPNKKRRSSPKTVAAFRTVPLSVKTIERLRAWKGNEAGPTERVVCGPGVWQIGTRRAYALFRKRQVELGMAEAVWGPKGGLVRILGGYCLHDLRHAFVASLIWKGVDKGDIATIIGHADPKTTVDIYGHLFEMKRWGKDALVVEGEGPVEVNGRRYRR